MTLSAMNPCVVIPVRRGSTRFPDKPLVMIQGKPLIAHCVAAARRADIGSVFVVTDDELICDAVHQFQGNGGGQVTTILYKGPAATGTDRVAWAAREVPAVASHNVIINMQGDILRIDPDDLRAVLYPLTYRGILMSTLAQHWPGMRFWEFADSPHNVKVTRTPAGPAFWRTMEDDLPGRRAGYNKPFGATGRPATVYRHHVGVYAFGARFLQLFASWDRSPTELALDLEQWRVLDHGWNIGVWDMEDRSIAINVPGDLHPFLPHPPFPAPPLQFFTG